MNEHNHGGEPTYVAYSMGCRHTDCLRAFQDYKLRLAKRRLSGDYRDLRLRENRLAEEAAAFRATERETDRDPDLPVVAAPSDNQEYEVDADAEVVLKYLRMCIADFATGRLNEAMVNVMPLGTRLPSKRRQDAAAKLIEDGALISDGTNLFIAQESR